MKLSFHFLVRLSAVITHKISIHANPNQSKDIRVCYQKNTPMQKTILILVLLLNQYSYAQTSNTFYGLARKNTPNDEIFLAKVDPLTGVVTNISPTSLSPIVNLTGAALDPYNNNYHFIGYNVIKTINLSSGLETNAALINNPIANSYFDNFRFNNSDSTLYGLARRYIYDSVTMTGYGEVFLSTINTTTGTITQISPTSVGQGYALAGSAIDPYQKVFYYSTGYTLMGLDMYNGTIYSNPTIQVPVNNYFDNFTYSCADTSLYGILRTNYMDTIPSPVDSTLMIEVLDSATIRLAKINPNTGIVTVISPYSIAQGGYSLNAGSTIDPNTMTYYYNNGAELIGVSLNTGLIVSQQLLNNVNGQFFELMRIESNCYTAKQPIRLNSPSSVASVQDALVIEVYPNPTSNQINVRCNVSIQKIEVQDLVGNIIISHAPETESTELDVSNFQQGIYMIKCFTGKQILTSKFTKN